MDDPADRRIFRQRREHRGGVGNVPFHAQTQRLDAGQNARRVVRRQAGAEVSQAFGSRPHDERRRAKFLGENEAVIAGVGLRQRREAVRRAPVEMAAVDDGAADDEAVAADPFGQRMHDEVGAELDRPAEIGRGEGVVDQERDARPMGDRRDGGNIKHFEAGIADGLADDELGVFPDRGGKACVIARLDEALSRSRSAAASGRAG